MNEEVLSLEVYEGMLIVGGSFTLAGGISANYIAYWNGSNWLTGGTGMNFYVRDLTIYCGQLIAGGDFTEAGGITANYIACLGLDDNWQSLGSGVNGSVWSLTVHDNELIAGGVFTRAGDKTAFQLAAWSKDVTDSDADGIPAYADNCPDIPNLHQTDSDGDGLGNECDNCPNIYNPLQEDSDEDGIGDSCTYEVPTPAGQDIEIPVSDYLGVTFDEVITSGTTEMTVTATGPEGPSSYQIVPVDQPIYYNLSTTATYDGNIEICIDYDDFGMSIEDEQALQLLHNDGDGWVDITTFRNAVNNIICGITTTLSPFVIALPIPYICGDANGDGGVNIGDVVYITNHVFRNAECTTNPPIGCPPDPYEAGDVNCDEAVNIGDAVYLGNVIFRPGSPEPCASCP
jgi:hypothetical protein